MPKRPEDDRSGTLEVVVPVPPEAEDRYINTRGASLNYARWFRAREVYCAEKNSPGDL